MARSNYRSDGKKNHYLKLINKRRNYLHALGYRKDFRISWRYSYKNLSDTWLSTLEIAKLCSVAEIAPKQKPAQSYIRLRTYKCAHRLWTKAKLGTSVNALLSLGLKILPYWLDLRLCFLPIKKRMEEVIFYLLFCIMHSTCDQTCLLYSTSRPLLSIPWGFAGIKKGAIFFPCACGYVDYEESPIFPQG